MTRTSGTGVRHEPATVSEIMAALERPDALNGRILAGLQALAATGEDLSPLVPSIERRIDGCNGPSAFLAALILVRCSLEARDWSRLNALAAHHRVEIRRAVFARMPLAEEDALIRLLPSIARALADIHPDCRVGAGAALERIFRCNPVLSHATVERADVAGIVDSHLAYLSRVAGCGVCNALASDFSVGEFDPVPPTLRELREVFRAKSRWGGIESSGFNVCAHCGIFYFFIDEGSFTGSLSNDSDWFHRLDPVASDLLDPLLREAVGTGKGATMRESPQTPLSRALARVVDSMTGAGGVHLHAILTALVDSLKACGDDSFSGPLRARIQHYARVHDGTRAVVAEFAARSGVGGLLGTP